MQDNRSIAAKAASITLKFDKNRKKITSSSALSATESPYFDRNCRQVLGNITNSKMNNKNFLCRKNIPTIEMISSEEILRDDGDTQENQVASSATKSKQLSDDFLSNLLKSQNANSMKSPGLSPFSSINCKSKRKKYLGGEASQRLMNNFKKGLKKNTGAVIPRLSSSENEIFPENLQSNNDSQTLKTNEKRELIHKKIESSCNDTKWDLMKDSGKSFEETEDNMLSLSKNNGYSAANASTYSEDLFDYRRESSTYGTRNDNSNSFSYPTSTALVMPYFSQENDEIFENDATSKLINDSRELTNRAKRNLLPLAIFNEKHAVLNEMGKIDQENRQEGSRRSGQSTPCTRLYLDDFILFNGMSRNEGSNTVHPGSSGYSSSVKNASLDELQILSPRMDCTSTDHKIF